MALTDEQYQSTIVVELNGGDLLSANIGALWEQFDAWSSPAQRRTRYLLTRNAAIDLLLGNLDEVVSSPVEGDQGRRYSERHQILLDLRRATLTELIAIQKRSGRGAVGLLTVTAIIRQTNAGLPDPNSPYYYGDLVNPPSRGRG